MLSEFNSEISEGLLSGCNRALLDKGVNDGSISVLRVPGAFELPAAAAKLAKHEDIDGVVALGAVIKGETDHYDLVVNESARSISQIALDTGVPVIFEVLATHTMKLALDRAGGDKGNAGHTGAMAAIETARVSKKLLA